jgi:hypothetical protein
MSYREEFPDFDPATMPAIPEGFEDVSWHNDSCPSFVNEAAGLILFVDFADVSLREFQGEETGPRFNLAYWDEGCGPESLCEGDDWTQIEAYLADPETMEAARLTAMADIRGRMVAALSDWRTRHIDYPYYAERLSAALAAYVASFTPKGA